MLVMSWVFPPNSRNTTYGYTLPWNWLTKRVDSWLVDEAFGNKSLSMHANFYRIILSSLSIKMLCKSTMEWSLRLWHFLFRPNVLIVKKNEISQRHKGKYPALEYDRQIEIFKSKINIFFFFFSVFFFFFSFVLWNDTSLKWTPKRQSQVSVRERCPYDRDHGCDVILNALMYMAWYLNIVDHFKFV